MLLEKNKNNRLLIYSFYDKDGVVDRYVTYLLTGMRGCVSSITVVVNGAITEEGRAELDKIADCVLVRENKGFDAGGYKAGLDFWVQYYPDKFDEVILMNCSVMGPLYPFSEMFETMDSQDVDFWGITMYHGSDFDPYGKIPGGRIPEHIQTYFTAIRKSMLQSPQFRNFWDNLPQIDTYEDAIALFEAVFTKRFENFGFAWDVYARTGNGFSDNATIFDALRLIRDMRCPVIKRRCFFADYHYYMAVCTGEVVVQALDFIRNNLHYDTDMIWETILRTNNQLDIGRALALTYVLPAGGSAVKKSSAKKRRCKTALIFHAYYDDLFETCVSYINAMPEYADIIFTTDTPEKKEKLLELYGKQNSANVQVLLAENRGRSESALLVAAHKIVNDYDYICFAHDKKNPSSVKYGLTGQSFAYKCFDNILASREFTENVIAAFEANPRLGMLAPPPPIHAEYYYVVMQGDWKINFDGVRELAGRLGLRVSIDKNKAPLAPLGGMMWFRTAAMKKLFDYGWKYSDFPEEPLPVDGTVLHAIERIYPLVVQDAGYYPARVLSDRFASIELTNLSYYLCELTKASANLCGTGPDRGIGPHNDLVYALCDFRRKYDEEMALSTARQEHVEQLLELINNQHERIEHLQDYQKLAEAHIAAVEARESALLDSLSWKVTAPLRAVMKFFKRGT